MSLTFSVDSLLLAEVGEHLVTKNYIALAELIKNAYDADAPKVEVIFRNVKKAPSRLSEIDIVDSGHGMTFEQVRDFWMRVATPNKLREPFSPRYGRRKTGDKGIGRFACLRLARRLILLTTAESSKYGKLESTKVKFNWAQFKAGRTLTEIPNVYEKKQLSEGSTGLTIKLVGLRESWSSRDFAVLRRQILGLSIVSGIRRKGFEEDPGFDIVFHAPEFEAGPARIAQQVMDAGWGRLRGSVSKSGTAVVTLEAMKIGKAEFELPNQFTEIPGASYDIAIIWRRKEYCRDRSILTIRLIDEISGEWSGVRVYLDGFRVYPYGDPGDDWLDLDKDVAARLTKADDLFIRVSQNLTGVDHSRAMLHLPGNRNLIGRVLLSNDPDKIYEITINREGFLENKAFRELKQFIRKGIEWATIYYQYFLFKEEQEEVRRAAETVKEALAEFKAPSASLGAPVAATPVQSALDLMQDSVEAVKELVPEKAGLGSLEGIYKHTVEARRVVEATISHLEKQTNALRTIASVGALMLTFVHEARTVVGRLDTHAATLERLAPSLRESQRREFAQLAADLRSTADRFDDQVKLVQGVSLDLTTTKRRRVLLSKTVDDVRKCFTGLSERFHIEIKPKVPDKLKTGPMLESEVYAVLINLISNSVKAVIAGDGHRIEVEAVEKSGETILRVYDDGIGLSKESRDLVGVPLVSDPEGRLYKRLKEKLQYDDFTMLGEGTGLGLSIVKEILAYYGKSFRFIDVDKPWKTCMEVVFP